MTVSDWLASDEGREWIEESHRLLYRHLAIFDCGFFQVRADSAGSADSFNWDAKKDIIPLTKDGGWQWNNW